MKRVAHATSAASAANASSASGSRSMPISVPAGPIRSATSRAWPAAPSVQSTATSPGRGSSASTSSPASTGTWVLGMSSRMAKLLGELRRSGDEFAVVVLPGAAVPQLQARTGAQDHDVLGDAGVLHQARRQDHAAGRVELL